MSAVNKNIMSQSRGKNKEIEVIATVTFISSENTPPDQLAKMQKVRRLFESWFTEVEIEVKTEREKLPLEN